jgi:triosephosphate isomerase
MPAKLVVANWKMHLGDASADTFLQAITSHTEYSQLPLLFAVPATVIERCAKIAPGRIGAQSVHWAEQGAFTGEISASMVKAAGANFTLCGHSERRHIFGESIQEAADRACQAMLSQLRCIFCVGETQEQRNTGLTTQILSAQLSPLIRKLHPAWIDELIVAYEPVWAIGSDLIPTIEQIQMAHEEIDSCFRQAALKPPPVLYGGSVNAENFPTICSLKNVAGALVGRASLSSESCITLAQIAARSH